MSTGATPELDHVRDVYAAAHVVAQRDVDGTPVIDWEATAAVRERLWNHGLGVADAMDTAQRGADLGWFEARELIERTCAQAQGRRVVCGATTDQLPEIEAGDRHSLDSITEAYIEQVLHIDRCGGVAVVMCSPALAASARTPHDYLRVYGDVLDAAFQTGRRVLLHWLGPAFDPALGSYWGSSSVVEAAATVGELVDAHAERLGGIKISLLDPDLERSFRSQHRSVPVYTGDDLHYPELIVGDADGHSHALLGAFGPLAAIAEGAMAHLAAGRATAALADLERSVALSRHLFAEPTSHYKTGVVFLAWLAGHQDEFVMLGDAQHRRSGAHLEQLHRLALDLGLYPDEALATERFEQATVTGAL